jgi:hypothetical protein
VIEGIEKFFSRRCLAFFLRLLNEPPELAFGKNEDGLSFFVAQKFASVFLISNHLECALRSAGWFPHRAGVRPVSKDALFSAMER